MFDADRLEQYALYHAESFRHQDIDPSYPMLRYVCDRFELNMEQRFWLAFLYGTCYCAPTVYYIYNEFPDFENVDIGRLERWWAANKKKCLFQTDRRRIQSNDQFVPCFRSYQSLIGEGTQQEAFESILSPDPYSTYDKAYDKFIGIDYFGRYTMFLYLESVHVVTEFPMVPMGVDWKNAKTSLTGLTRAYGLSDNMADNFTPHECVILFNGARKLLAKDYPAVRSDVWSMETTLCAFKKHLEGRRYVGYYVHRQLEEIEQMERAVRTGVNWKVLYDFRKEHFTTQSMEAAKCTR